ncbi:MAG: hypothetical protein ACLFNZ_03555 [Spirochaetaceae bacterium]
MSVKPGAHQMMKVEMLKQKTDVMNRKSKVCPLRWEQKSIPGAEPGMQYA